jgi:hypothetical protein
MTTSGLAVRVWNGTHIGRREDGFVNATAMCRANGRQWKNYIRLDRSQQYLEALAGSAQIRADRLIDAITTGPNHLRGTWIHPRLAVDLARWISPQFAVWMDGWFLESLEAKHQIQHATEASTGNGRIDLVLTLLHEAINTIDPARSFKPSEMEIFVQRLGPMVRSAPLRKPTLIDAPFKTMRRVHAAAL